jgi:hypothetical protein
MNTTASFRFAILIACINAGVISAPVSAQSPSCITVPDSLIRTLSGLTVRSLEINTANPERMPGPAGALDVLHVRTGKDIIRRQLLINPGEPLDTLRLRESVHRLRRQGYISDVALDLQQCSDSTGGAPTVRVVVLTRDSWSTAPLIRVRSSSATAIGIEERNVMGTGRSLRAYVRSDAGRTGVGLAYVDPWLFDSPISGALSRNVFRDGRDWRVGIGTRQRSVFDEWRGDLTLFDSRRRSLTSPDTLHRSAQVFTLSHVMRSSPTGATSLLSGFERERTRLAVFSDIPVVGPRRVNRDFVGLDLGLARYSAHYEQVDWYLPGARAADLPRGFEGEGSIGLGRDFVSDTPMMHADLWAGRFWFPRRDLFAITDIWMSGYLNRDAWSGATRRAAVSVYKQAAAGMWIARVGAEQLTNPDPDVRTLESIDPTVAAIPSSRRLAESAVAISLERSAHLFGVTRGYVLDGALFTAASSRWDPASASDTTMSVGIVGAGLRLNPRRLGGAGVRLDVGYPVLRSSAVKQRIFVGVSLSPWIEVGRGRQGLGF